MADPTLYDLLAEPDQQTYAAALQDALRRRAATGALIQGIGGRRLGPIGSGMVRSADAGLDQQTQIAQAQQGQRLRMAMDAARLAQDAAQNQAAQDRDAQRLDLERQRLGLQRSQMDQDAWSSVADPVTGGIVMFNRKTGETRALGPGGGKPGSYTMPPPKPKDLEDDVQKLGKDVEPVGQMKTDLQTLDAFVAKGSVPGFGPIAGRVPDVIASNDAVAARQAAKRIMAAYIQMRSGTAASDREVERLLAANGLGPTATDEQIRQGVTALRGQAAELVGRMEAKYHPSVVETYKARGGVTRDAFGAPAASQAAPSAPRRRKFNPATGTLE